MPTVVQIGSMIEADFDVALTNGYQLVDLVDAAGKYLAGQTGEVRAVLVRVRDDTGFGASTARFVVIDPTRALAVETVAAAPFVNGVYFDSRNGDTDVTVSNAATKPEGFYGGAAAQGEAPYRVPYGKQLKLLVQGDGVALLKITLRFCVFG